MHEFSYKPYLTKQFILNKITQEEIFIRYLGFFALKKKFRNPLRSDDKKPACNFFWKNGTLFFRDYGSSDKFNGYYDCFNIVQLKQSCNFQEALFFIATDFNLWGKRIDKPVSEIQIQPDTNWLKSITVQRRPFTEKELLFWQVKGLKITALLLNQFWIWAANAVWYNEKLQKTEKEFTFAYNLTEENVQIYRPSVNDRSKRFRSVIAEGIFGLEFARKNQDYILLTKSKKDHFYISLTGVNAAFILNESYLITLEDILLLLEYGKRIILFVDNDGAGKRYAEKIQGLYPFIEVLYLPENEPKDYSDYIHTYDWQTGLSFLKLHKLL